VHSNTVSNIRTWGYGDLRSIPWGGRRKLCRYSLPVCVVQIDSKLQPQFLVLCKGAQPKAKRWWSFIPEFNQIAYEWMKLRLLENLVLYLCSHDRFSVHTRAPAWVAFEIKFWILRSTSFLILYRLILFLNAITLQTELLTVLWGKPLIEVRVVTAHSVKAFEVSRGTAPPILLNLVAVVNCPPLFLCRYVVSVSAHQLDPHRYLFTDACYNNNNLYAACLKVNKL
jgi:hypothetical protein